MKRTSVGILGLLTLVGTASAADFPTNYSARPAPAPYSWTGFYSGFNAGGGFGTFSSVSATGTTQANGFLGGATVGAQAQFSQFVVGFEGDFQGTSQQASATAFGVTATASTPWFGTVRGRVGFAADQWLFYATGGVAFTDVRLALSALGTSLSSDTVKAGLAAGAGVEWMYLPNWSMKLEYLYTDTGNTTVTFLGVPINGRFQDQIGRVGLNYHF